ncbi:uncharacterized protein LOC144213436 isoform X5 [Stigmatopora nigra]
MSDSLKGKCDDASQVHCPERQESAPMVKEENEELVRIIEEEQEYFITVGKFHIEEQQRLLIKVEEVPLYIKEEGVDVPVCTFESLGNEDEGPSEASSEPLSCSTSTESFQAENLMPPPPVSRDTSSHLQSQQRHRHHQNPCVEMSAEKKRPKFHEELFDLKGFRLEGFPQQKMKDEKIPIKKEEDHFTRSPGESVKRENLSVASEGVEPANASAWPQIKEEEPEFPQQCKRKRLPIKNEACVKWSTGEPFKSEDDLGVANRGTKLLNGSSTEGWRAENVIAPLSDVNDLLFDDDDVEDVEKNPNGFLVERLDS